MTKPIAVATKPPNAGSFSSCSKRFHSLLHHAIINVCESILDRWRIDDIFASRNAKGREAASSRAGTCGAPRVDFRVGAAEATNSIDGVCKSCRSRELAISTVRVTTSCGEQDGLNHRSPS